MNAIFVHGVTVRKMRFLELVQAVQKGLVRAGSGIEVHGFYWGDHASSLRFDGASIPGFQSGARAAFAIDPVRLSDSGTFMSMLFERPDLELRAMKDAQEFDPAGGGFLQAPGDVKARNQTLSTKRKVVVAAIQNRFGPRLPNLPATGAGSIQDLVFKAFDAAGHADRRLDLAKLLDPMTRCLTAGIYRSLTETADLLDPGVSWTELESEVQTILKQELGGQRATTIIGEIVENIGLTGATWALRHGLRRRIMKSNSLFVGDVMIYLTNREQIQEELEAKVAEVVKPDEPFWLIAHSLGGIIAFDYCCRTNRTIERLVTVGSQVGLFGELGSLKWAKNQGGQKFDTPARVKYWINIYDPDDILSFLAAPIFTQVVDEELRTGAPFPASHSEYWYTIQTYAKMLANLPTV